MNLQFLQDQKKVIFKEDTHQYFLGEKELLSVSGFIKKFGHEFDPDGSILRKCAAKEGISTEQLRSQWDRKRDLSCEIGTSIHKSIEIYLRTGHIKRDKNVDYVKKFKEKYKPKGKVFSEVILFNDLICGTADIIEVYDNSTFSLRDIKTNEKIDTYNFGQMMLPPLGHIKHSTYEKYVLQLSIYSYILADKYDLWPSNDHNIFWINRKKGVIEKLQIDLRLKDVEKMVEFYKKGLI